jgi:hypothetical protein
LADPEPDRPGEHLWVMFAIYRVNPAAWNGEDVLLDEENLATAGQIGCYVCEQPYEKRLTYRRCPGRPT